MQKYTACTAGTYHYGSDGNIMNHNVLMTEAGKCFYCCNNADSVY